MAPPKKGTSQATATSKGKLTATRGTGPPDAHPPQLDIHIKDVREEHSLATTTPEIGTNRHETWLPVEGQLL